MATTAQINAFIDQLGALAVAESNRRISEGKGFVLPSVCIAQSALETGWGTSGLMTRANAYFGIKAGGSWTGKVYTADTWEVANGQAYNTSANFRAYDSLAESVRDYYDLIGNNTRYANGLSFGTDAGAWLSPKACITAIWAGGYATDTLYVEKIMTTINARNLAEWDAKIDGVSFDSSTNFGSWTFKKSDFVQGSLVITDSGRSIQNDRTVQNAVSIEWDKAMENTVASTYQKDIQGIPDGMVLSVFVLVEDSVLEYGHIDKIALPVGKFGVMLRYQAFGGTTPANITPNDLPDDLSITFTVGLSSGTPPDFNSEIAYFVKIS